MAKKIDKEVKENQEIYKFATDNGMTLAQARQYYTPNDPLKETAKAATSKKATTPQPTSKVTATGKSPATPKATTNPYTQPIYNPYYNYGGHDPINNPTHNQRVWLYADSIGDEALKDAAHQAEEASRSAQGFSGGVDGSQRIALTNQYGDFAFQSAPVFYDAYGNKIADQRNKILNREAFSYNPEEDPLFAVYQAQYNREGNRATQNTIGEMAARTGGLASSYAGTAAAQAGQYYAQQLADRIPELQQLAYSMHMDDLNMSRQDLAMLEGASDRDYGRFMDSYGMWSNDRDFANGEHWKNKNFDYTAEQDALAEARKQNEWNNMLEQQALERERYASEWAHMLEREGIDDSRYVDERDYNRQQQAIANSRSSGGGGNTKSDLLTYDQAVDLYNHPDGPVLTEKAIASYYNAGRIPIEVAQEMTKQMDEGRKHYKPKEETLGGRLGGYLGTALSSYFKK